MLFYFVYLSAGYGLEELLFFLRMFTSFFSSLFESELSGGLNNLSMFLFFYKIFSIIFMFFLPLFIYWDSSCFCLLSGIEFSDFLSIVFIAGACFIIS